MTSGILYIVLLVITLRYCFDIKLRIKAVEEDQAFSMSIDSHDLGDCVEDIDRCLRKVGYELLQDSALSVGVPTGGVATIPYDRAEVTVKNCSTADKYVKECSLLGLDLLPLSSQEIFVCDHELFDSGVLSDKMVLKFKWGTIKCFYIEGELYRVKIKFVEVDT